MNPINATPNTVSGFALNLTSNPSLANILFHQYLIYTRGFVTFKFNKSGGLVVFTEVGLLTVTEIGGNLVTSSFGTNLPSPPLTCFLAFSLLI